MNQPSIAVIGGGAIGGITAAHLVKAGYDVELVCKYSDRARDIREDGLRITGVRGEFTVKMKAVADIEELSGPKDLILIVTKAYDMPDAARRALPFMGENTLAVSMQNGICVEALAAVAGLERTVGCVVGWGATMLEGDVLNMTSEGDFVIGAMTPGVDVTALQEALGSFMPTRISDNIIADLYTKMIINSCITSLGVLSGLYLGEILRLKAARNIFISIIREAMAVAAAMKLTVKPYGGKLDYYKLMAGSGGMADLRRHLMIRVIGFKYRRLRSSSLQSLLRGKPTEIDYFNGYIAGKGRELGVPTPVNSRITAMIREIEAGRRSITVDNLSDPGLR